MQIILYISPLVYAGYLYLVHQSSFQVFCQTLRKILFPTKVPSFREVFLMDLISSAGKEIGGMVQAMFLMGYILGGRRDSIFAPGATNLTIFSPLIVTSLPFAYRMIQSTVIGYKRTQYIQFVNATKHLMQVIGIVCSYKKSTLWLLILLLNTVVGFGWEVLIDWDVWRTWGNKSPNLHSVILSEKWFYVIIVQDLILRALWIVRLTSGKLLEDHKILVTLSVLEIFRMAVWAVIRVEVELHNLPEETTGGPNVRPSP
ncbi:hypothetical protein MKX03_011383 [Papaver bracteatum]|nr:hypothetical protein MKX03_011383 [Papaver bracteatum]